MDDISMAIEDDMYFNEQHNQLSRKSFYAQQIVNHLERFQDEQYYDTGRCKIFIEANNE